MNKTVLCSKSLKSSNENMTVSGKHCNILVISYMLTYSNFICDVCIMGIISEECAAQAQRLTYPNWLLIKEGRLSNKQAHET